MKSLWADMNNEEPVRESDENEKRHFECPECARWFDWNRKVYIRKADGYFCGDCAEMIGGEE